MKCITTRAVAMRVAMFAALLFLFLALFPAKAHAAVIALRPMQVSPEMVYHLKYESSQDYDHGLSPGDGYHAMGFYQFDNRSALGQFMQSCYNYNPTAYACFKIFGDKYGWDVSGVTYNNGFTTLGNELNMAWHTAYRNNPTEFSELQNYYYFQTYYYGTNGAYNQMLRRGIDLNQRPDCLKALATGMTSLFGEGGVRKYFDAANLRSSMTDAEVAYALTQSVINNYSNATYQNGIHNRYRSEYQDCLNFISTRIVWRQVDGKWLCYNSAGNMLTGWVQDGAKWYYMDPNTGIMQRGWIRVNNKTYYLNNNMVTGWLQIDGDWYLFDTKGVLCRGWVKDATGKWYYLDSVTGVMQTGWLELDGRTFYLDNFMVTGPKVIDGFKYCFGSRGDLIERGGWQKVGTSWYYLDPNTAEVRSGWIKLNGKWYYLDDAMAAGVKSIDGQFYCFDSVHGNMLVGWAAFSGKWYYAGSNGALQLGWFKSGGYWYYLNPDSGAMATGWNKVDGIWYYLGSNGRMRTGWQKVNGVWYYLGANGHMRTGWQKISGIWYYFGTNGHMVTGWNKVDGIWYHMTSGGAMEHDTWYRGGSYWYYLASNGHMLASTTTAIGGKTYTFDSSGHML